MRCRHLLPVVLFFLFLAPSARAEGGQGWSVLSGQLVGRGRLVFHGQVGFPGVSGSLLTGVNDKVDVGGRFSFFYAREGVLGGFSPGLRLQGLVHLGLVETQRLNLGLDFEPGAVLYFPGGPVAAGLLLPVNLRLGIPVSSALMLSTGVDVPLYVNFAGGGSVSVPVLFDAGLEYYFDRSFALTLDLKMGPTLRPYGADFTLYWLVGVATFL